MMGTKTIRRLFALLMLVAVMLAPAPLASAAEAGLAGSIKSGDPLHPVLTLKNNSDTACQVVASDSCIINGTGTISHETSLPATGTYTLTIDPANATTAELTIRIRT
jgi:hypothetical protein